MRTLIVILAFVVCHPCFSQLFIGNTSFVYNKDVVLTVTKDISMNETASLYLRGDGQLLQMTAGNSANSGNGKLSVFQEGSSNQYKYNYWCSPVGGSQSIATGNDLFGISQLYRPTGLITSVQALIASANDPDGTSNPLKIAPRWIWKYQSGFLYSEWIGVFGNSTIAAGEGFTMKGVSGTDNLTVLGVSNNPGSKQRYEFKGRPNDGTILVNVGNEKFTLTGNPYPSALDVSAFLLDSENTAIDRTAYYYEQSDLPNSHILVEYVGGYGVFVPVSINSTGLYLPAIFFTVYSDGSVNNPNVGQGLNYQRRYAPIGQGFMVNGINNGVAKIKNTHRKFIKEGINTYSQFERTASLANKTQSFDAGLEVPSQIRINVRFDNGFSRPLAVILNTDATEGSDIGMEAVSTDTDLPIGAAFFVDGKHYIVNAIPFDINQKLPITVKTPESKTFTFVLSEMVNVDPARDVYIYDSFNGTYHNLCQSVFSVVVAAGETSNRFELRFTTTLGTPSQEMSFGDLFYEKETRQLVIHNPEMKTLDRVSLYDISGRQIFSRNDVGNQKTYRFPVENMPTGVYIFNLITNDGNKLSKKLIIQ